MKESLNGLFRLADDDQYDEIEEEFTERDEEYEDDEDYDEEYDDGYDEEEPYDEEYDDYEDGYEDGYDDQYYDDRLNKVLEEIAELKRGMAAPAVVPPQPPAPPVYPPQNPTAPYVYTNNATPQTPVGNGFSSEVVMYNEISRLRDELSRTQNTQSLHMELTRLKDEMERDQRVKEDRYLDEIRRLNEKIETLQKNELGPQSDNAVYLPTGSEGVSSGNAVDLEKLISINEAILMNAKNTDVHVQSELNAIKDKLAKLPDFDELNKAVGAIRRSAKAGDPALAEQLAKLKESIGAGNGGGDLGRIEAQLDMLARTVKGGNASVDNSEIFRQLFEIKNMLGYASATDGKHNAEILVLYNELAKTRFHVTSQTESVVDKLSALDAFCKKLSETNETDLGGLIAGAAELSDLLYATPLDRRTLDNLSEAASAGSVQLPRNRYEAALSLLDFSDRAGKENGTTVPDYLGELVAAKNAATDGKSKDLNEKLQAVITEKATADANVEARAEVKDALCRLTALVLGDLIELPRAVAPRSIRMKTPEEGQAIYDKLNELKALLESGASAAPASNESAAQVDTATVSTAPVSPEMIAAIDALRNDVHNISVASELNASMEELKKEYLQIVDMLTGMTNRPAAPVTTVNEDGVSTEAQFSNNDLSTQLYNVRDELLMKEQETNGLTQEFVDLKLQESADKLENILNTSTEKLETMFNESAERLETAVGDKTETLTETINAIPSYAEDLAFIKTRLDDWDVFISQIGDLRADLLTANETEDLKPQFDKLYEDMIPQFDKLYEDLAAAVTTSETNLGERVNQAVSAAVADISAGFDAINDAMASANGSSTELFGAISDLRTDFDSYAEKLLTAGDSASLDRARLLDDIAFIREQMEVQVSDGQSDELSLRDKLLDELALLDNRLAAMESALTGGAEGEPSFADHVAELSEQIRTIDETANNIFTGNLEFQTSVYDDLTFIKEKLSPDEGADTVAEVLENVRAVLEKLTGIEQSSADDKADVIARLDDIKEQLHLKELEPSINQVAESAEERETLLTEIAGIRERLAAVEDAESTLGENVETRLQAIDDGLNELRAALATPDESIETGLRAVTDKVNEVIERVDATAVDLGNIALIMDDIAEIKTNLAEGETNGLLDKLDALTEKIDLLSERGDTYDETLANIPFIMADIEEIKNKLLGDETAMTADEDTTTALADLSAQMTDVLARIDENTVDLQNLSLLIQEVEEIKARLDEERVVSTAESTDIASDDLAVLVEDVGIIKEKLSAADEYDVVAEILSLREEVKAARIVDQNDVSSELEAVRTDILDRYNALVEEIRSMRDDWGSAPDAATQTVVAPTSDELNMVLGEIVSLRDEVQAYKDEITAFAENLHVDAVSEPTDEQPVDDNSTIILDELTNLRAEFLGYKEESAEKQEPLRADMDALKDNLQELKDMIARRTTIAEPEEGSVAGSNELNVVLDELIDIKDELNSVQDIRDEVGRISEQLQTATVTDTSADNAAFLETVREQISETLAAGLPDFVSITQEIEQLKNQVADLQLAQLNAVTDDAVGIREDITALREQLRDGGAEQPADDLTEIRDEIAILLGELRETKAQETETESLKDEIIALKEAIASAAPVAAGSMDEAVLNELTALREEIAGVGIVGELKAEIAELKEQLAAGPDVSVMTEVMALRDEVATLKEQLAAGVPSVTADNSSLLDEIASLREEIATLRSPVATQSEDGDYGVLTEILALRDEFQELKNGVRPDNNLTGSIEELKTDVQSLRDEPDLGVMSEILALRDEFQAMKEQIRDTTMPRREQENKSSEEILSEVQALRDQLFAISMANVNDGTNDTYESYNNIILDEITALRDELNAIKAADRTPVLMEDVADIREKLAGDDKSVITEQFAKLKADIESLKVMKATDATNDAILIALDNLKEELANQREADVTTLNFMAEMAHLLERQNQYINQNSNEKLTDEIESLKAEIATSLNAPSQQTSKLIDEIAALKAELSQSMGETVVIDNQAILDELAALKEEISKESPTNESQLVLKEIARLKDEISAIAEKESAPATESKLSQSINDLKNELSQIADLVTDEKPAAKPTPRKTGGARKPAQKKQSTGKSGAKSTKSGAKKTPAKKKENASELSADALISKIDAEMTGDALLSKIDSATLEIPRTVAIGGESDFNPMLDFQYQPQPSDSESEDMDVASRLAKQVANKLIMEQLVQQLGDGGVSRDKVEEIVRDILPQEFTTVAISEQSDRVRRLANSLVLDKLRARLTGKKPE